MSVSNASSDSAEMISRHFPTWSPKLVDAFLCCADVPLLKRRLCAAGLIEARASDSGAFEAYFSSADAGISPSALFDERWYRAAYPDVEAARLVTGETGFSHFVAHGVSEGRWPNATMSAAAAGFDRPDPARCSIDASFYLDHNASAKLFLQSFPIIDTLDHYNLFGRFLHHVHRRPIAVAEEDPRGFLALVESEFGADWYARHYLSSSEDERSRERPFEHYLEIGIDRSYSPNAWFQEDWYRAYYPDVAAAIPHAFLCGFQHYLTIGRSEGRIARFDLATALEDQIPGVTEPVLVAGALALRRRFFKTALRASRRPERADRPTMWFLLPNFNPDIVFGGYRACFELLRAARSAGFRVAIYCTFSTTANKAYFLWRQSSDRLRTALEDVDVFTRDQDHLVGIGPNDRIVAYTVMDLYTAATLASWTTFGRPYLLTQEFEPIFFDSSSNQVLTREAYTVPHYPIINSTYLYEYLKNHRVGVFAASCDPIVGKEYAVFEHRINQLPRQSAQTMAARTRRLFVLYARPERHAARNLFELAFIALQNLCRRNVFGPEWTFVGLGALSTLPSLDLGNGHSLLLYERTSEEEYTELIRSLDIGVSLMYAPHPGVVALEFASSGALVVTNTYENRSAHDLRDMSNNIVPCEPSLADLERAIVEASERVGDHQARVRDAYRPMSRSWDEIFDTAFMDRVFRQHADAP